MPHNLVSLAPVLATHYMASDELPGGFIWLSRRRGDNEGVVGRWARLCWAGEGCSGTLPNPSRPTGLVPMKHQSSILGHFCQVTDRASLCI